MGVEIERRFLVLPARLPRRMPRGAEIFQGFLALDPVVRVRLLQPAHAKKFLAFLTVKGRGLRVRAEFEYPIPAADARLLLKLCGARLIRKTRLRLGPWELDRYRGRHQGLWIAEIELPRPQAPLPRPRPPWLGREVTTDPRFTNVRLATAKRWPGPQQP